MIALITDSTAGFTKKEALEDNVIILPMYFSGDNSEYVETYLDDADEDSVKAPDLFAFKTASTNVEDYNKAFSALTGAGHKVICLTISSRFSSAFANAAAAKEMAGGGDIAIIDSKSTAGGLYLLVKEAVDMIKSGESFENSVALLYEKREKTGIVFSVENMAALRKSGRIGIVAQSAVTILNMRPILSCRDGTVVLNGSVRGTLAQIRSLVSYVPQNSKRIVVHGRRDNHKLKALIDALKDKFDSIKTAGLSNVLTVHLGYNAIGVAWLSE